MSQCDVVGSATVVTQSRRMIGAMQLGKSEGRVARNAIPDARGRRHHQQRFGLCCASRRRPSATSQTPAVRLAS